MYLLSRGLAERGHEVTLICDPGSHIIEKAREAGLRVAPLRMRSQLDLRAVWEIRKWIKEKRIEIINTHKPLPHTLAVLAAAWTGCVVVATRGVSFPLRRHLFRRWKWDKAVAGLIAVSKGAADGLIASGIPQKKVVTIYNAVDFDRFHPDVSGEAVLKEFRISPSSLVVGQVADLRHYKGYGVLIDAAAIVLKEIPDVYFFCIGRKGTEYEKVKRKTHKLGIERQVIFTGFRGDVESFYKIMTLCVNSNTAGEGLGCSLMEALAMQVPVVGTDVSGIRELVIPDRTGVLVRPRDPQSLAEGILGLLRDPARRRKMGVEGRRFMEAEFSIRTMVDRTESLYQNLIKNPRYLV